MISLMLRHGRPTVALREHWWLLMEHIAARLPLDGTNGRR
jgi:hypothetical protein